MAKGTESTDTPKTTPQDTLADEASLAAAVSAEHAIRAAEQAEKDAIAVAEATKEDPKARLCPTCHAEMIKHGPENPFTANSWHCNSCGSCWAPGLREQRAGHTGPARAR